MGAARTYRKMFATLVLGLLLLVAALIAPGQRAYAGEGQPASYTDYGSRMQLDAENLTPIYGNQIKDGTYTVAVRTDSNLFDIVDCQLTVTNGSMTATVTLAGRGYTKLYRGVGTDACVADSSEYAEHEEDGNGRYCYTIDVPSLNSAVEVTALSRRKNLWYDHHIIFLAASMPTSALDASAQQAVKESSTVKDLPNGVYTCYVALEGGTGRASLTNPCQVTLNDGLGVARIEWSSQFYDYMIVGGKTYYPVNDGGNSIFEIPINVFDAPIGVVADTTALSQPYEIKYNLTFYSSSLEQKASTNGPGWPVVVVVAALFAIGYLATCIAAHRSHMTARERRKK